MNTIQIHTKTQRLVYPKVEAQVSDDVRHLLLKTLNNRFFWNVGFELDNWLKEDIENEVRSLLRSQEA